jgi:hypothetical protein
MKLNRLFAIIGVSLISFFAKMEITASEGFEGSWITHMKDAIHGDLVVIYDFQEGNRLKIFFITSAKNVDPPPVSWVDDCTFEIEGNQVAITSKVYGEHRHIFHLSSTVRLKRVRVSAMF